MPVWMCEYICCWCWCWCWVVQTELWAQREGVRPTQTSIQPMNTPLCCCMLHLLKAWCLFNPRRWGRRVWMPHKGISTDTSVLTLGAPNIPHTWLTLTKSWFDQKTSHIHTHLAEKSSKTKYRGHHLRHTFPDAVAADWSASLAVWCVDRAKNSSKWPPGGETVEHIPKPDFYEAINPLVSQRWEVFVICQPVSAEEERRHWGRLWVNTYQTDFVVKEVHTRGPHRTSWDKEQDRETRDRLVHWKSPHTLIHCTLLMPTLLSHPGWRVAGIMFTMFTI